MIFSRIFFDIYRESPNENAPDANYGKSAISRYFLKIPFYSFGKIGVETHRKPFRKHPDQSAYFNISRVGGGLKMEIFSDKKERKETRQNDTYRRITHTDNI